MLLIETECNSVIMRMVVSNGEMLTASIIALKTPSPKPISARLFSTMLINL